MQALGELTVLYPVAMFVCLSGPLALQPRLLAFSEVFSCE